MKQCSLHTISKFLSQGFLYNQIFDLKLFKKFGVNLLTLYHNLTIAEQRKNIYSYKTVKLTEIVSEFTP